MSVSLSNTKKHVYLQQTVKGGSAEVVIEGMSHYGDQYLEAMECLNGHYNRPHLIHQAHVCSIMDAPPLNNGMGLGRNYVGSTTSNSRFDHTKLRSVNQTPHLLLIILRFDNDILFEWQRHTQIKVDDIPHYSDILKFIDPRGRASETTISTKKQALC